MTIRSLKLPQADAETDASADKPLIRFSRRQPSGQHERRVVRAARRLVTEPASNGDLRVSNSIPAPLRGYVYADSNTAQSHLVSRRAPYFPAPVFTEKQVTVHSAARRSAQLNQNGTIAASEQLISARSMHPIVYQSHIATTHIRGSIRLLNARRSMLKVMELLEPLATRDGGGVRFTHSIWRLDDPKTSSPILQPTLERQNLALLQGICCVGSAVLSPHVSAEKFAAGGLMCTDCTRVPMTNVKLRVGWRIVRSYGKGLRVR
jgi:hypothetical protein